MKKDILIISCERSRTHFVINSIAFNYGCKNIQIDVPPTTNKKTLKEFFELYKPTGIDIVKSHHQAETLSPFWNILKQKFHIFYIIREGRDVLTSWFYYFNKAGSEFPYTKNVGELIKKNPQSFSFDAAYSEIKSNTMVERWARHVLDWIEKDVNIIDSDALYSNFRSTLTFIGFGLGNKTPNSYIRPLVGKSRSVAPRKGIVGDFIDHFSEQDNIYFFKEIDKIDPDNKLYNIWFNKNKMYIKYIGE